MSYKSLEVETRKPLNFSVEGKKRNRRDWSSWEKGSECQNQGGRAELKPVGWEGQKEEPSDCAARSRDPGRDSMVIFWRIYCVRWSTKRQRWRYPWCGWVSWGNREKSRLRSTGTADLWVKDASDALESSSEDEALRFGTLYRTVEEMEPRSIHTSHTAAGYFCTFKVGTKADAPWINRRSCLDLPES